jgi:hypothetical protein
MSLNKDTVWLAQRKRARRMQEEKDRAPNNVSVVTDATADGYSDAKVGTRVRPKRCLSIRKA